MNNFSVFAKAAIGVLLGALALALLFGCGGGSGTVSAAPLSKQAFVKQAGAICARRLKDKDLAVKNALANLSSQQGGAPSKKEIEALGTEAVLPAYESLVGELEQLTPSSREAPAVEKILRLYKADLTQAEEDPAELTQSEVFKDADERAKAYGLDNCVL